METAERVAMPEGYQTLDVAEMTHVGLSPENKAVIWMQSTTGLKVCLAVNLTDLERAIKSIRIDHVPHLHACLTASTRVQ